MIRDSLAVLRAQRSEEKIHIAPVLGQCQDASDEVASFHFRKFAGQACYYVTRTSNGFFPQAGSHAVLASEVPAASPTTGSMRLYLGLSPNTEPVPYDHLDTLRSRIHRWLGENDLHDALSLYSFSWLSGARAGRGHLTFPAGATWTVSFYDPSATKTLLRGVLADPVVTAGMHVTEAQEAPEPEFDREHRFLVASPVLARRNRDDGGRDHLRWDDPEADKALTRTFHTKLRAAGLNLGNAALAFDRSFDGAKTKLVAVKGTQYRANACPVIARGTPEALRLLWLTGAGELTGCGLGALR